MTWFIHHDERILGPLSTERVLADLRDGLISYGAYIWAKGQVEWLPITEWEENIDDYTQTDFNRKPDQLWKIRSGKTIKEGLNIDETMVFLKGQENFQQVFVSPNESEEWVPIYSSYVFMEALNLSRRNFLRAPLMGLAKVTRKGSRFSYVVKTGTIGQGGLGVYGLGPNFQPGTDVQIKVESEDLNAALNVVGSVVYNTDKGFVGIRFADCSAEANAIILDYIHRFRETDTTTRQKVS